VITNISFDHVGFLGDTLEKIAYEKAGIIKPNTPVVIGESLPATKIVFETKAKEVNAPMFFAEEYVTVKFKGYSDGKMWVETSDNVQYKIGLSGLYQLKNVATTITAIEQLRSLKFNISDEAIRVGVEQVTEITGLQGRWQQLQSSPLVICDTGHNVGGIQFVVEQIQSQQYKTLRIVIGMVNDKDVSAVLALMPTDAVYYFTQANIVRALPAEELLLQSKGFGLKGQAFSTVKDAVNAAIKAAQTDDFVFIGGSNFVVGEALGNCEFE